MKYIPTLTEKRWNHKLEEELWTRWEKEGVYKFDFNGDKPIFVIDTPPPYVSGRWHIAAAVHYTQIDMVARYFRLQGYNVLFPMGLDRNGLPVEIEVERVYGVKAHEMDREEFIDLCKRHLDKLENELLFLAKRLGIGAEYYSHMYRTDSAEYRAFTQATFIELWRKGLVYEDYRPTIWCPVCYTTIAEAEIEYVKRKGKLYYIRFPIEKSDDYIVIATTRPELLGATVAVMYNPEDDRYKHLLGCKAIIPLYNYSVPIIEHTIVKMEFGTGIMMLSSFGDIEDVRLFRELGFKPRILITPEGTMNKNAGPYAGLTIEEARKRVVEDLDKEGYLEKVEVIDQNIPTCWRSHNPIEFIFTKDLYLKQLEFRNELLKLIDKIEFYPEEHRLLLINWINSLSIDWAISRHRYYGTEVPLWYCKKCGQAYAPEPGKYYRPWKDPAPVEKCEVCGSTEFKGDERTFDTWMDSSVSPLFITGYMRDDNLYKHAFPVNLRPQGIDIVRTWLYYTILRVYLLTGKPAFKMVRLSGLGLDEHGRAMSKSLGNIVDPLPLIEKYGADAIRLWGASAAKLGSNYRFSESKLSGARKFITKLWNIARFVSMFPYENRKNTNILYMTDIAFLEKLNELIQLCKQTYDHLDFFEPANNIRSFVWNLFASHYIEFTKARAYNSSKYFDEDEQKSAWYTLHTTLRTILLLLHPITPYVTDFIWRKLYSKNGIVNEHFPKLLTISRPQINFEEIMQINNAIWKYKNENKISLRESIDTIYMNPKFKIIEKDIKMCHHINKIIYRENIKLIDF